MSAQWWVALSLVAGLSVGGCTSSPNPGSTDAPLCAAPGGAATGAVDSHCTDASGPIAQPASAASCHPGGGMPMDMDAGMPMDMDAGMPMDMDGGMPAETPADPRFNAAGDDDDCKYHVAWTATSVCQNADVSFTLTITRKADGQPAAGASPHAEALLSATHPAPNSAQTAAETSAGTYQVGPVRFDASGRWTVRFHLYEDCEDTLEDSPHGHVAFYVDVP